MKQSPATSGAFLTVLLGELFVPFLCRAPSKQTHEFDETRIGRIAVLWCKCQLRLLGSRGALVFLSNGLFHRNAGQCRLHNADAEHHQPYDGQQQRKSGSKNWIQPASSVAPLLVAAYQIAVYRRAKTC